MTSLLRFLCLTTITFASAASNLSGSQTDPSDPVNIARDGMIAIGVQSNTGVMCGFVSAGRYGDSVIRSCRNGREYFIESSVSRYTPVSSFQGTNWCFLVPLREIANMDISAVYAGVVLRETSSFLLEGQIEANFNVQASARQCRIVR